MFRSVNVPVVSLNPFPLELNIINFLFLCNTLDGFYRHSPSFIFKMSRTNLCLRLVFFV